MRPIHAKAMPVILRSESEQDEWLNAQPDRIETIQARGFPSKALEVVSDDEAAQYVGGYIK